MISWKGGGENFTAIAGCSVEREQGEQVVVEAELDDGVDEAVQLARDGSSEHIKLSRDLSVAHG